MKWVIIIIQSGLLSLQRMLGNDVLFVCYDISELDDNKGARTRDRKIEWFSTTKSKVVE